MNRKTIIGLAAGPGRLTKKQAEREAWDRFLSKVDVSTRSPQAIVSVEQFVSAKYWPHVLRTLKPTAQKSADTRLRNWVLPGLGTFRLTDVRTEHVEKLVYAVLDAGRSVQTAYHVRNCISGIFTYAKRIGWFSGENPAALVSLPAMTRKESYAYSFEQARRLLEALKNPIHEIVFLALTTSLRIGELRGLRWKRINLTEAFTAVDGEALPPYTLAVRENFQLGKYQTEKSAKARRNVPLSRVVVGMLASLKSDSRFNGPDDPVFASRKGRPIDSHNVSNRVFRPLAKELCFPVAWHVFRHTHATWLDQAGMSMADRVAQLGHAADAMTLHYSHADLERRRISVEEIAVRLMVGEYTVQ